MAMLDTRALRYFLAVARSGSITEAANQLHLTQPTFSRQIKILEDQLHFQLFTRRSHSMELTPEGLLLKERAQEIIDLLEKTQEEFRSLREDLRGEIFIGTAETAAMQMLAVVLQDLHQQHPHLKFYLESGNAELVCDRLDSGVFDFGLVIDPVDTSKYDSISLPYYDHWGVFLSREHPLSSKQLITKEDLVAQPLIFSRQVLNYHDKERNPFIEWFGADYEQLNIVATFNLLYNSTHLVAHGMGLMLSLAGIINMEQHPTLVFRYLNPGIKAGVSIIWKKNRNFLPAGQALLQQLKLHFGANEESAGSKDAVE